jgi:hypothetical protein
MAEAKETETFVYLDETYKAMNDQNPVINISGKKVCFNDAGETNAGEMNSEMHTFQMARFQSHRAVLI